LYRAWVEHDAARQEAEQAARHARIGELANEQRDLLLQPEFMPVDAERLRTINAQLGEIAHRLRAPMHRLDLSLNHVKARTGHSGWS
jgi:hypothetical protein